MILVLAAGKSYLLPQIRLLINVSIVPLILSKLQKSSQDNLLESFTSVM